MLRSNQFILHPQNTLHIQADVISQCLDDRQVREHYNCDVLVVVTPCFIFIFSVSFCIEHLLVMFRKDEKLDIKYLALTAETKSYQKLLLGLNNINKWCLS